MIDYENSEHFYTDDVTCPHCNFEHGDSWEMEDESLMNCHECDKEFYMFRNYDITYTTCLRKP